MLRLLLVISAIFLAAGLASSVSLIVATEARSKAYSEGGSAAPSGTTGDDVVRTARNHIGTPHRFSPPGPCRAFRAEDCACHTKLVFERFRISLPDDPAKQWHYGQYIAKSNLRPGDLVFFKEAGPKKPITHVGIYSGNGNLVHASRYWGKVVEKPMKYINGYYGATRLRLN